MTAINKTAVPDRKPAICFKSRTRKIPPTIAALPLLLRIVGRKLITKREKCLVTHATAIAAAVAVANWKQKPRRPSAIHFVPRTLGMGSMNLESRVSSSPIDKD